MREGRPSLTAQRVALFRAAHQQIDDPKVYDDPLAIPIVGAAAAERLAQSPLLRRSGALAGLRAWIVARSRYAEDELSRARDRGVEQYVVLGAGLDTLAYRSSSDRRPLAVFEVDYPATQSWKRNRLREASIPIPSSVRFVPTDFEAGRLGDDLAAAGFRREVPAFFGWLGVTMYLTRPSIAATLDAIAGMAPGSGVVLDYFDRSARGGAVHRVARGLLAQRVAFAGERFVSAFDPGELPGWLRDRRFREIRDLGRSEVNARYFAGRADRLEVHSPVGRIVSAELGPP